MNFKNFIFALSFFFICVAFSGGFVMGDVPKNKGTKIVGTGTGNGGLVGGPGGKGHILKDDNELEIHHALEELKILTSDVTKKTRDNRSLLIGSALANFALFTIISVLVGYNIKETRSNKDSSSGESGKPSQGGSGGNDSDNS